MTLPSKTFCSAVWNGVFIGPMQGVCSCCNVPGNPSAIYGNLADQPLSQLLSSDVRNNMKKQMLAGEQPPQCHMCFDGILQKSLRDHFNETYPVSDLASNDLEYIDIRMQNTCNLGCVYCIPQFSSFLANESDSKFKVAVTTLRNDVFSNIPLHKLKAIYLAGGEPLLITDNIAFLNRALVESPNVKLIVNSNASNLTTEVYRLIRKFPSSNIRWIISVDNVGEEYEYVRFPGKWDTFKDNVKQIIKEGDEVTFNAVYFALNSLSIIDVFEFVRSLGLNENCISVQPIQYLNKQLDDRGCLDVRHLPDSHLAKVAEVIKAYPTQTSGTETIQRLVTTPFDKCPADVVNYLQKFDLRRRIDSRKIFPHLYEMIESK